MSRIYFFIDTHLALFGFSQKKTSPAVKNNQIYTLLITETTILADRCNFSDKDGLDFTFILVHDREDRRGRIRDENKNLVLSNELIKVELPP